MVLMKIYPFYKGTNIAKDIDGYESVSDANKNMVLDELINDFEKSLPDDFWDDYYYICRADEHSDYKTHTVLVDNWTEVKSNESFVKYDFFGCFSHEAGMRYNCNGVEYVKTEEDVKKDVIAYHRPELYVEKRRFLKKIKNKNLSSLLWELLKIENSDVSKMNTEEQHRCVFVYEELDRLGYYPRIQRDNTEYKRRLREYIHNNVEFREIHKDYYKVVSLEKKQKKTCQENNKLF